MSDVRFEGFEWDADKAAANLAKHGVTFEEAATVINNPSTMFFADANPENSNAIGYSISARCLFVVSTERGDRTRIVSARRATKREEARYHRG